VGSAVEQILKNVDLASIQDERARECIRLLLNLIESLTAELRKAQAENQYARAQRRNPCRECETDGGGNRSSLWRLEWRSGGRQCSGHCEATGAARSSG